MRHCLRSCAIRAGRYLLASHRQRDHRHVRTARGRCRCYWQVCGPRDPGLAQDAERPGLKAQYGHGHRSSGKPGAFSGPQLLFSQIAGQTSGGGVVSGRGTVTFSGGKALLNLVFNAKNAQLLNRDDVAAQVTGPAPDQVRRQRRNVFRATSISTRAVFSSAAPAQVRRCRS